MRTTKTITISIFALITFLFLISTVSAGTISLSLGSYDTEIYKQETVNIPVTVTSTNITGTVNVVLTPKSGLSCNTCTLSASFSGGTNEQQTVTFTLTGTQSGTYNPPFVSISASSGSTQATPISSGSTISVSERPTWTKDLEASDTALTVNDQTTLTLEVTPSGGSFSGVTADMVLPSGVTLISGNDPKSIGTVSGTTTVQWIVKASTAGTKNVQVKLSAASPQESASSNIETVSLTVTAAPSNSSSPAGGGSSGGGGGGSGEIYNFGNLSGTGFFSLNTSKYAFSEVEVTVKELIVNAKLYYEKKSKLDNSYPQIDGPVYQYLYTSGDLIDKSMVSGTMKFGIEKSWLENNSVEDNRIFLLRYNGNNWIQEQVTLLYKDDTHVYYKALVGHLGMFAIASLPKVELEYVRFSTLKPELIDLGMVIESGLSDALMIDRIESYIFGKLRLQETIAESKLLASSLEIKREVNATGNKSRMFVTITNNKLDEASFILVEAVPKSIVHDIYELKEFEPRKYDLVIREDPVIQWSFGEADTAIVAWEVKGLKRGDTAEFSYSLDAIFDIEKYPAPIIIKPVKEISVAQAADDDHEGLGDVALRKDKFSNLSIIFSAIMLLAIISVIASMRVKGKDAEVTKSHTEELSLEERKEKVYIEKISHYIIKKRSEGLDDDKIKKELKKVGWKEKTIEKAFFKVR